MNENALNLVKTKQIEMTQMSKDKAKSHKTTTEELMEYRVAPETQLKPVEFLFKINGVECFPLAELVANTGKAKSGKTLFLAIIMACCRKKNVLNLERIRDEAIRVLWYDTEQSAQSTQQIIVNRILPLAGIDPEEAGFNDEFFVFNVRGIGWEKRRELLAAAIEEYHPDIVIVDGIKDLITDINDGTQATLVIEDQMGMAQAYNCCIVDVLHQNKSDADRNMRGWIGTELTNKAFEVWSCSIVPNTDTFKVEQVMSRMKRCEENLYYRLDENAIPVPCDQPDEQPRDANGRFASKKPKAEPEKPQYSINWGSLNRDYIIADDDDTKEPANPEDIQWDLVKLFTDAMEGYKSKRFTTLMATIMHITNINDNKYYYHLLQQAKDANILSAGKDESGQQCFFLKSHEPEPF